jgi:hypothetical protein
VIEAIVAGCQGNEEAIQKVREIFPAWREQDAPCVDAVEAIWNGERDAETLTGAVGPEGSAILQAILARLEGKDPYPPATESTAATSPQDLEAELLNHFRPVIEGVVAASGGDEDAHSRVASVFPEWRKQDGPCVDAVEAIIAGERDEATLTGSAKPQGAVIIRAILARLRGEDPFPAGSEAPRGQAEDILRHFRPIIETVVAACNGDADAKAHIDHAYDQLQEGGWKVGDPIRRIVEEEARDETALTDSLDPADATIVRAILARLNGENPYPPEAESAPASGADGEDEAITLGQLIEYVEAACRPDAPEQTVVQIRKLTQGMSQTPGLPENMQKLGEVLFGIVEGERDPDLSGLSAELSGEVKALLVRLG